MANDVLSKIFNCSLSPSQPISDTYFFLPYSLNSSLYLYLPGTSLCSYSVSTMTTSSSLSSTPLAPLQILSSISEVPSIGLIRLSPQPVFNPWFSSTLKIRTHSFFLCVKNLPHTTRYHPTLPTFPFPLSPLSSLSPFYLTAVSPH